MTTSKLRFCRFIHSTTAEGGSLLEELRAAYQMLGREERQQIKSLMLTLSISRGDLLSWKESTNRKDNYGKQPVLERYRTRPPSSRVGADKKIT
jgi:hypothetical protein